MKGFSADGFITDQDYYGDYIYRTCPANINGCGPIALYNMFHYLSMHVSLDAIISEMNSMYKFNIPGPTTMSVLKEFIQKHFDGITEIAGRKCCIDKMANSGFGILRYNESGVPHIIFYYRVSESIYRFFNVEDGLEDYSDTIENFSKRLLPGLTILFFNNRVGGISSLLSHHRACRSAHGGSTQN